MLNTELLQRDPFDAPTPGQSLTDTPNKWQWEKPAEITDVNEAFDSFVASVLLHNYRIQGCKRFKLISMPSRQIFCC